MILFFVRCDSATHSKRSSCARSQKLVQNAFADGSFQSALQRSPTTKSGLLQKIFEDRYQFRVCAILMETTPPPGGASNRSKRHPSSRASHRTLIKGNEGYHRSSWLTNHNVRENRRFARAERTVKPQPGCSTKRSATFDIR